MNRMYRVVCSSKFVPCKIVRTIFTPDITVGTRKNISLDQRVPITITSETINRFRPYIYVQGKRVADDICNWLNKNNGQDGQIKYQVTANDAQYDEFLYSLENDIETNFVYQRTFGLNIEKCTRIPLFYTTEGYLSLAVDCLDQNKWKWNLDGRPTLENCEKKDELEK